MHAWNCSMVGSSTAQSNEKSSLVLVLVQKPTQLPRYEAKTHRLPAAHPNPVEDYCHFQTAYLRTWRVVDRISAFHRSAGRKCFRSNNFSLMTENVGVSGQLYCESIQD